MLQKQEETTEKNEKNKEQKEKKNEKKKKEGEMPKGEFENEEYYIMRKYGSVASSLNLFKNDQLCSKPGEKYNIKMNRLAVGRLARAQQA